MNWVQELDDMKKRLKEMEDEAAALREMQAKVEKEMGSAQGASFSFFFSPKYVFFLNHLFFLIWKITFFGKKKMLDLAVSWVGLDIFKIGISSFLV